MTSKKHIVWNANERAAIENVVKTLFSSDKLNRYANIEEKWNEIQILAGITPERRRVITTENHGIMRSIMCNINFSSTKDAEKINKSNLIKIQKENAIISALKNSLLGGTNEKLDEIVSLLNRLNNNIEEHISKPKMVDNKINEPVIENPIEYSNHRCKVYRINISGVISDQLRNIEDKLNSFYSQKFENFQIECFSSVNKIADLYVVWTRFTSHNEQKAFKEKANKFGKNYLQLQRSVGTTGLINTIIESTYVK
jgi:hypothetical protein